MHLMMTYKGNAHFPQSLMSSFCSLKPSLQARLCCWNCKMSNYRRVLIHVQMFSLYATLSAAPHKILQIHLMDFFYLAEICENFFLKNLWRWIFTFSHFSVYSAQLWITLQTKIIFRCLPKGFLPQETPEQGDLSLLKISPEETFAQKRPLGQE